MACFLAPLAEAVVVSVIKKAVAKKEETTFASSVVKESEASVSVRFETQLGWLMNMLYGGSFLLAIEHIWHGEVVLWPPFLTAMKDPSDTAAMLHEILTTGVSMAVCVTAAWGVMLLVYHSIVRRTGPVINAGRR